MVPPDYRPSEDEAFMNPIMVEYFRQKLLRWRSDLLHESTETLQSLQEGGLQEPDIADRASAETDRSLELRNLTLNGVIRPEDISAQNTISYDKIAEARVSYGGRGQLTDAQQPRYGSQLLDIIWPF